MCVVQVLVLCPTQELCVQVLRTARQLLPLGQTYAQPLVGKLQGFCRA
jgi:superfamily II DNA/RNA helicase